ncbi:MAG TPA: NADH-quinone oxidoreductase subunit H, partial [Chitinophagales bacterium]|nr:NADH-quinone oxidoreductase subunit H [Chitinophagales bacterium]
MEIYLIYKALLVLTVFLIALGVAAYATYAERKVAAFMQDRIGPDRAGPFGLLQPIADGIKMFMKEEIMPTFSNKFLFILGPSLAMMTALMAGCLCVGVAMAEPEQQKKPERKGPRVERREGAEKRPERPA